MKHVIYQMDIIPQDPEANREKVEAWVKQTVQEEGPDVIVLPEMWTTAYALPELDRIADEDGEPTTFFLQQLALTYDVNIIGGSYANNRGGKIYNTSTVIDREGRIVYEYDKIHLVPMLNEPAYLEGGKEKVEVFELDGVKMGLIICYDLRFPELSRRLALEGAEVLYVVAEWPTARKNHWKNLQIARAIENQMFVVSCNRIGSYKGEDFAGMSMMVDPWGDTIKMGSEGNEEAIVESLDLKMVSKIREDVPIFKSRVPRMY